MRHRVVITGMGAVSPLGGTLGAAASRMERGEIGIGPITRFSCSGLPASHAGLVGDFLLPRGMRPKDRHRYDLFVLYACAAAAMAIEDAGLGAEGALGEAGVVIGSGRGGLGFLEHAALGRATAFAMAGSTVSMAAAAVARLVGAMGHATGVSNACSSGTVAIGEAARAVRHGYLPIALAGGAESPVTPLALRGYGATGALSRNAVIRPFDMDRDGFVLAEGAAVVVLESYEHARARGARVWAEVAGYAATLGASHPTAPDAVSAARTIERALADAGLGPDGIGAVVAHATGTRAGDRAEALALQAVFGSRRLPITAPKSLTGHMLGASGAFECCLAARVLAGEAALPPVPTCSRPEFDLDIVDSPRAMPQGSVLLDSFGFGGANAALVINSSSAGPEAPAPS